MWLLVASFILYTPSVFDASVLSSSAVWSFLLSSELEASVLSSSLVRSSWLSSLSENVCSKNFLVTLFYISTSSWQSSNRLFILDCAFLNFLNSLIFLVVVGEQSSGSIVNQSGGLWCASMLPVSGNRKHFKRLK